MKSKTPIEKAIIISGPIIATIFCITSIKLNQLLPVFQENLSDNPNIKNAQTIFYIMAGLSLIISIYNYFSPQMPYKKTITYISLILLIIFVILYQPLVVKFVLGPIYNMTNITN